MRSVRIDKQSPKTPCRFAAVKPSDFSKIRRAGRIAHDTTAESEDRIDVGADPILTHPADPTLTRGWKPTAWWSAVDKCRSMPGLSSSCSMLRCSRGGRREGRRPKRIPPRGARSDVGLGWRLLVGPSRLLTRLDALLGHRRAVQEPVALVARLDDVAVMCQPVQHAVVIFASPNTLDHSAKSRLLVIITLVCSYSFDSRWNSNAPPAWLNGR